MISRRRHSLEEDLQRLEDTDPEVAQARSNLEQTMWRLATGIPRRTFKKSVPTAADTKGQQQDGSTRTDRVGE